MNCSSCGEAQPRSALAVVRFGTHNAPLKVVTCADYDKDVPTRQVVGPNMAACRQRRTNHETNFWGSPAAFAAALWAGRIRRHGPRTHRS